MTATARSTANAAQTALITRLQARSELADTLIQVGLPAEAPKIKERVYLAAVEDLVRTPDPAFLAIQQGVHQETYTLTVLIECHHIARDSRAVVNDRMWQIIAELEQELADDQELADNVDSAHVQAIASALTLPATDGWIAKAIVHIRVEGLCDLG